MNYCPPGIPNDCPRLPVLREHEDGRCDNCGTALIGRRKRWCSDECGAAASTEFSKHHDWNAARVCALIRDKYRCVRCGVGGKEEAAEIKALVNLHPLNERDWPAYRRAAEQVRRRFRLEVNHIVPRNGRGYGRGCWNHLDNLETLCHPCHVGVTASQRRARSNSPAISEAPQRDENKK